MSLVLRLAVTVVVPLIAWLLARVSLPGVDAAPAWAGSAATGIVALGIVPALSGFTLVEIVAAAIPPWRALRRNGPPGRRTLRRASLSVTIVFALVQGFFLARYLESALFIEQPGVGFELLITVTLAGGTALLLSLAWIVDQFGLGNGLSVLIGAGALTSLLGIETPDAKTLLKLALAAAMTGLLLTSHRRRPAPSLRDPVSGIVPLHVVSSLFGLVTSLIALGVAVPSLDDRSLWIVHGVAAAIVAIPLALCFQRGAPRALVWPALARTVAWLVAVVIFMAIAGREVLSAVILTAVAADLFLEWQARRRQPTLVAAWALPSVASIDEALAKLRAAGIDAFPRAAYHRALYQFFAPYLQLDLLVPLDRAEEAQSILQP